MYATEFADPPVFVRSLFCANLHLLQSWLQPLCDDMMAGWTPSTGTKLPVAAACHAPILADGPGLLRRDGHKRLLPQRATAEHHLDICAEMTDMTTV